MAGEALLSQSTPDVRTGLSGSVQYDSECTFSTQDWIVSTGIFVLCLLYAGVSLNALDFVRHTEADRTLVGLEMLKRSDYLIPHLLGDVYATKPPGFYWILALFFGLFGDFSEWIARLPSAIACAALGAGQYIFLRLAGSRRWFSLLAAAVLMTSGQFFKISVSAEIDMLYATLCGFTLYFGYFSVLRENAGKAAAGAYVFMTAAFLVKGPPVILFFVCGVVPALIVQTVSLPAEDRFSYLKAVLRPHFIGSVFFMLCISVWLFLLLSRLGTEDASFLFRQEIVERFYGSGGGGHKPALFYLWNLPGGLLPWTPLLLGFFVTESKLHDKSFEIIPCFLEKRRCSLIFYSGSILLLSLLIFSVSSGKAGRYLFPVYPFAAILLAAGGIRLYQSGYRTILLKSAGIVSVAAALASSIAALLYKEYLAFSDMLLISGIGLLSFGTAACLFFFSWRYHVKWGASVFILSLALLRIPYNLIYAPYQNQNRNYRSLAAKINEMMSDKKELYILEMPERWIAYYLIRANRTVLRLTPQKANELKSSGHPDFIHLLLGYRDERWRKAQLFSFDPGAALIKEFKVGNREFGLFKATATTVYKFKPKKIFPTRLSRPKNPTTPG